MQFQYIKNRKGKVTLSLALGLMLYILILALDIYPPVAKAHSIGQDSRFAYGSPTGYSHFQELGAQIKSIRFGKEAPRGASFSAQEYFTGDTSRLYYFFNVQFTKQVESVRTFDVEAIIYKPDGSQLTKKIAHKFQVRPGSEEINSYNYIDWVELGNSGVVRWPSGTYRLDLVVDGITVGSGNFHISQTINAVGNSSGNLNNKGLVAQQGNWIYFVDNEGILHRIKFNGQDLTRLTGDTALYLNVQGPWIYYVNDAKGDIISRIRIDGRGTAEVIVHDQASSLMLYRNSLYYINHSDGQRLYKVSLDGGQKTKLSDVAVHQFTIFEDAIYYILDTQEDKDKSSQGPIYRQPLQGGKAMQVTTSKAEGIVVTDGWVYFINTDAKSALYRIKIDGSLMEQVAAGEVIGFYANEDWVYYQTSPNHGRIIYKLNVHSREVSQIETKMVRQEVVRFGRNVWEFPYTYINVANQWLYYSIDNQLYTNQYRIQTNHSRGGEEIKGISDWDWRR